MPCILATFILSSAIYDSHFGDYFTAYRNPCGAVQDRGSDPATFSCASSGFGLDALAIRAAKGTLPREDALREIHKTLDFYSVKTPAKNRGWLYHFHDKDGNPKWDGEVSSIDTGIFYQSARQAAKRLGDPGLTSRVDKMIAAIDVEWMVVNSPSGKRIAHGLTWDGDRPKFIKHEWDEYNEGVLLYRLFRRDFAPTKVRYDLPLFVYFYPLAFSPNDPEMVGHLDKAVDYQIRTYGHAGITSTDTQHGYAFFPTGHVSPLALYSASKYSPAAREQLAGKKPTTHSLDVKTGWVSNDRIGIDEGAALLVHNPVH